MNYKPIAIIFLLLAACQLIIPAICEEDKSLSVSSEQFKALILVSAQMTRDNISIDHHSFNVEERESEVVVRVAQVPALRKGGVITYFVSKTKKEIVDTKYEK